MRVERVATLYPGFIRYSPETDEGYLPVDDFIDKPIDPADLRTPNQKAHDFSSPLSRGQAWDE